MPVKGSSAIKIEEINETYFIFNFKGMIITMINSRIYKFHKVNNNFDIK